MSQAIVRRALEKKLNTWAAAQTPAIPIAWENVEFTPPTGRYLRVNVLPLPTLSQTLDRTHRRYAGIFQITLVLPIGAGPSAAESLLSELVTQYTPAITIVESSVRVYILEPASAAPAIQEADRYVVPVSINYEAHVV